jgi:hypothetical protein
VPAEQIICVLGRWYEIAGVFVCCTDHTQNGVTVKVSTDEPRAKVRRRKLAPSPPPLLQLPSVTSLSHEIQQPGEMTL